MSIGRRYAETRDLSLPEVAQWMRADVAQLKTDGRMPVHAVVSVRIDQKGTSAIDITVSGLRDAEVWRTPGLTDVDTREGHWGGLTRLGRRVRDALESIHAAYNYDSSEPQTDYFDVRYYGGVHIADEESQRREADGKARRQACAAASRAARHAAEKLPLRATIVGDRDARLVITDSATGDQVAVIDAKGYSREILTASLVEYLLGTYGWNVAGYRRRSKTNPVGYWAVCRAAGADPVDLAPAPTDADTTTQDQAPDDVPTSAPRADAATHTGNQVDAPSKVSAVELDPADWADLHRDHWAARWVRDTQALPVDDPARIWSQANAVLIAASYRHQRHDGPGSIDHTARLITTDARDDVADEAAELSCAAAAVLAHQTADIRRTNPYARPIVLDGTGLSGTRCEAGCGALARWSVPNPAADEGMPSRFGYCRACVPPRLDPIRTTDPESAVTAPDPVNAEPVDPEEFEGATILHTAETGTLILGTTKGDGSYDALRAAGQRWRGLRQGEYAGALFLPHTRDRAANRYRINHAAEVLCAAGWTVQVHIDDTPRDPAEVAADRQDRTAARVNRLRDRAAGRMAASGAAYERAAQIGQRFAGGQPILQGHHSEKRARRDRDRMDAAVHASCELRDGAEHDLAAAGAAETRSRRQDSPQFIARRIERNAADERRTLRALNGYIRRIRYGGGYLVDDYPAATGSHREQLLAELAHLRVALAADRQALQEKKTAGTWRPVDPAAIKPGDAIHARGRWEKVVRVNRTTVSVDTGYTWTDRVPLTEITDHRPATTVAPSQNPEDRPSPPHTDTR